MTDDMTKAREIARFYAMPNSGIDSGNLYWALHVALRTIDGDMRDCLHGAAATLREVTIHAEAPEWIIQDCRIALAHIGAVIKENVL